MSTNNRGYSTGGVLTFISTLTLGALSYFGSANTPSKPEPNQRPSTTITSLPDIVQVRHPVITIAEETSIMPFAQSALARPLETLVKTEESKLAGQPINPITNDQSIAGNCQPRPIQPVPTQPQPAQPAPVQLQPTPPQPVQPQLVQPVPAQPALQPQPTPQQRAQPEPVQPVPQPQPTPIQIKPLSNPLEPSNPSTTTPNYQKPAKEAQEKAQEEQAKKKAQELYNTKLFEKLKNKVAYHALDVSRTVWRNEDPHGRDPRLEDILTGNHFTPKDNKEKPLFDSKDAQYLKGVRIAVIFGNQNHEIRKHEAEIANYFGKDANSVKSAYISKEAKAAESKLEQLLKDIEKELAKPDTSFKKTVLQDLAKKAKKRKDAVSQIQADLKAQSLSKTRISYQLDRSRKSLADRNYDRLVNHLVYLKEAAQEEHGDKWLAQLKNDNFDYETIAKLSAAYQGPVRGALDNLVANYRSRQLTGEPDKEITANTNNNIQEIYKNQATTAVFEDLLQRAGKKYDEADRVTQLDLLVGEHYLKQEFDKVVAQANNDRARTNIVSFLRFTFVDGILAIPHIFIPATVDNRPWYRDAGHVFYSAGAYVGVGTLIDKVTAGSTAAQPLLGPGGVVDFGDGF